jgi:carboxypeptidase Q
MKKLLIYLLLPTLGYSQVNDSSTISNIYKTALTKSDCYESLRYLCKNIGPRLSGSENADKSVIYLEEKMKSYGFDRVYLQEVKVPVWRRLDDAKAEISTTKQAVNICALGGSIATSAKGIKAEVIEVQNFDELDKLGEQKIKGKIVFYNRPMEATHIETFHAYGGAVNQRGSGAAKAAKYGAVACIVRSMNLRIDEFPHTGAMRYDYTYPRIPAAAISTRDAELLSASIKKQSTTFFMKFNCDTLPDKISYNVIGEIKGSVYPEKIITVGGHLDSWDLGEGAHDDGAGCVQSLEVLHLFKTIGIRPKHTIRAVMFMNEENGLRGGYKYAEEAKRLKEQHLAAIETDAGGFTPRGFSIDAPANVISKIKSWEYLLKPYGLHDIGKGGSGADIGPLKAPGISLIGYRPDSQRYFDVHHAETDVFEAVNKRELELGAASIAALVYLIDQYGL